MTIITVADKDSVKKNQAVSFEHLYEMVWEGLYLIDDAMNTYSRLIDLYLTDDKNIFAVIAQDGKLYKQHFILEDEDLLIGDFEEIPLENNPSMTQNFNVFQQEDGKYRWIGIAATTALNKNGNFNSKQLYDSFIKYIEETGEYPILNFYHQPNTRLGVADFAARDDNLYILSGTFDDSKFGIAAAQGLQKEPDYWGQSIEFLYQEYEWYKQDIDDVEITIPIFTKGINDATSILPREDAACLETSINGGKQNNMNEKIKKTLGALLGSEDLADEFENLADSANQEINENTIHQSTEEDVEIVEEEETEEVESENDTISENELEIVLDEEFIDEMLTDLVDHEGFNQMVQSLVNPLLNRIQQLENQLSTLQQNQQNLEVTIQEQEQEQHTMWQNDQPRQKVVSYRARGNGVVTEPKVNNNGFQEKANSTLNKIRTGVS